MQTNSFESFQSGVRSVVEVVSGGCVDQSMEYVQQQLSLNQDWGKRLLELGRNGTDIAKNCNDPEGDGDLSRLTGERAQLHRNFWCIGGDVIELIESGTAPDFIVACFTGNINVCMNLLSSISSAQEKASLLETRYSVLRFSAIFFAVVGQAQVSDYPGKNNFEVIHFLLSNGARVDARDLCGKTVLHYLTGPLFQEGDGMMTKICDICIQNSTDRKLSPRLVDTQDRFGTVPLTQSIMSNRIDLVEFLCTNHLADGSIADYEGVSPLSMANLNLKIRTIITTARNKYMAATSKRECHNCHSTSVVANKTCSRCKLVFYCSSECQTVHWKAGHKRVCCVTSVSDLNGFIITPLRDNITYSVNGVLIDTWSGPTPSGLVVGEEFDVKIQVGPIGSSMDAVLYNKNKSLYTNIKSTNCSRYNELCRLIYQFEPFQGRKAYMKAKILENETLFIASQQLFIKKW